MTIQELIVLSESKLTSLNGEMVVAIQRGDIDEIKRWDGAGAGHRHQQRRYRPIRFQDC